MFERIRNVVKRIPKGKVATYGQIASLVGIRDARKVGWAVFGNQDVNIPCHRVVFANGSLAKNYSLGGYLEQKRRLWKDGVKFSSEYRVDLERYLWRK
ncbi:MAG: methylated-DNA--[protein]-cysteine S-methyltransferase [Patescibacteria group bacterium]|nr:methylated-DNA--[protein]-cysteine S-methyltransferase [Patescibacteria group bacterium]